MPPTKKAHLKGGGALDVCWPGEFTFVVNTISTGTDICIHLGAAFVAAQQSVKDFEVISKQSEH